MLGLNIDLLLVFFLVPVCLPAESEDDEEVRKWREGERERERERRY